MEEWRAVVGYSGYEISSFGRVRRLGRGRGVVSGRILKPWNGGRTKLRPCVSLSVDGVASHIFVHRLVAVAFHGTAPTTTHQVNHRDTDTTNNHAENLEWVTPAENSQHAAASGLLTGALDPVRGEAHYRARLTEESVQRIRTMSAHMTQTALAEEFGVAQSTIWRVIHRVSWGHAA